VLFRVGDPGSLFYIILEGAVGIYIKLPSQSDPNKMELKEINVLRAGASFGELALLNENVQRSATIVAKCDCELAIMEKRDFKALLG
jgi:CRP-like cAMP-binding protein